ncbi:MAG: hypothetical protein ACK4XJ_08065 [Fimbriimonadaceae bacterium]
MSFLRKLFSGAKNRDEYLSCVRAAIADGKVTNDEWRQLRSIAAQLDLRDDEREQMHQQILEQVMHDQLRDGAITEMEWEHLQRASMHLGVAFERLNPEVIQPYWALLTVQEIQRGRPPIAHAATFPLNLRAGEVGYMDVACAIVEQRAVGSRATGGFSGVSFRIAKGIRYTLGGFQSQTMPNTMTVMVSQGTLCFTSKRVVYLADKRGFDKAWNKVNAIEPWSNAVTFYFSGRQNAVHLMYVNPAVAPVVEAICWYCVAETFGPHDLP